MKLFILLALVALSAAAPNYGYGAPALRAAAYEAPAFQEIHSRELTGYKQEILKIPEVHTEVRSTPTHVEIAGHPYDVPTLHTETRAVQGFRDETVPRTAYREETITKQGFRDEVITVPGVRQETQTIQDFKEELVPVKVPFTRYETINVPTEEHRTIQVPTVEYEQISVPYTEYDHIRVPETHYETIQVPGVRTEIAYDVREELGYADAINVPSVREEIRSVPIYEDVVRQVPLPSYSSGYGAAPALLKSGGY